MNLSLNNPTSNLMSDEAIRLKEIYQQMEVDGLILTFIGGSISLKTTSEDLFGHPVESLLIQDTSKASPVLARLEVLRSLAELQNPSKAEFERELSASRLNSESSLPNETSLLHACIANRAAVLITCVPIMAMGSIVNWREKINAVFGPEVVAFDYAECGVKFYSDLMKATQTQSINGLYLRFRGLLILADNLDRLAKQASVRAQQALKAIGEIQSAPKARIVTPQPIRVKIAKYRQELSKTVGQRLLVCQLENIPADTAGKLGACSVRQANVLAYELPDLPQPEPEIGTIIHAQNASELEYRVELTKSAFEIQSAASRLGPLELLPIKHLSFAEIGIMPNDVFKGEVALVTGAAAGIGKACVESLLIRGAAVIALDIKSEIIDLFDTPAYLGMECDLTNEAVTLECFEKGVRAFGGLDMLVLNAGIFPASCNLDAMTMEYWRRVMEINLDVNVTLLRESYPLLKCAPGYGRVVINASRNVPAPGPGAAAYSASKSALTQLGRVAALEWSPSHIRVNILHPHAVFDTGIWTDEVIKSRASKYKLTVDQYKTNNLLGVELSSHDIGELVAEMLGPVFSKTTGAQIPIDGGSDRVI